MSELIRRIEVNDFQEVSDLFLGRKGLEELKWLFTDPDDKTNYNAYVAVNNEHRIIGVIGYMMSDYIQNDKKIKGVIPIVWKILPSYKGMAGILLFKKVIGMDDFAFTISGTDMALDLYPLFKLEKKLDIIQFYKILDIFNVLKSYKRKSFVKTLSVIGYLLPSYFYTQNKKSLYTDIELIKYNGDNYSEELKFTQSFQKVSTKNYIDWLLLCPEINSYAFIIKRGEVLYGACVLSIKVINNSKRGRIIHLPFLGNDKKIWKSVIQKCIDFFKKENCCLVTSQSHHTLTNSGYSDSGFIKIDRHNRQLFIKDPKNRLKTIKLENWHLQYSEGDKFYFDL